MHRSRNNVCLNLGKGVYSLAEAAQYTKLPYRRVWSWFRPNDENGATGFLCTDYDRLENRAAISFHDLIDVLVAGQFRERGLSLQRIRAAYEQLKADFDTVHPFCRNELFTDGKNVFARVANELNDECLFEVISRQNFFPKIMLPHLRKIEYDTETSLALRWAVAPGIVLDPQIALGKPVLRGTGKTTYVIANAFHANNRNVDLVADAFGIETEDVLNAVDFEERNRIRSAA